MRVEVEAMTWQGNARAAAAARSPGRSSVLRLRVHPHRKHNTLETKAQVTPQHHPRQVHLQAHESVNSGGLIPPETTDRRRIDEADQSPDLARRQSREGGGER
jgi:hypothetical protein